jgi:peptide/nickel transport system permease protein
MALFIIRRLIAVVAMLVVISMATFALFFAAPTDPAALTCGRECSPEVLEANREAMGLDKPITVQYLNMVKGLVTDRYYPDDPKLLETAPETVTRCEAPCLGYSFLKQEEVSDLVAEALPVTVSLALGAFVIWMVVGVGAGVLAATRRGTWVDRSIVSMALVGYSLPTFFIGLLLLTFVSIRWGWLPAPTYTPLTEDPVAWATGLLLPWAALAVVFAAGYIRLSRAYMIESLSEDYIRTARAKGASERRVILKHGLRAALTPIVTMAGLDLGGLLGGMVVTEQVFGLKGIGKLAIDAVTNVDLPVIVAVVLVAATAYTLANLAVDLIYGVIDPRVRRV